MRPEQKKALIRQYKDNPPAAGLYRLTNEHTGRFLVGTSRNVQARLNRFRMNLKTSTERNEALQRDWHTQAGQGFRFEVLDTLNPSEETDLDEALDVLLALWWEQSDLDPNLSY
jgi:hypothetical protein